MVKIHLKVQSRSVISPPFLCSMFMQGHGEVRGVRWTEYSGDKGADAGRVSVRSLEGGFVCIGMGTFHIPLRNVS